MASIREDTSRSAHLLDRKQDLELLDWLSAEHYGTRQSDTLKRWHRETGQWFLNSKEFQDWLHAKGRTLYCPGIPGAGKTIMASAAIDYIGRQFSTGPGVGLAYIYFVFSRQREQTLDHVLASLLVQLLRGQSSIPDFIHDLSDRHRKRGTRPTHDELLNGLHRVMLGYERAFIVLDALDECSVESQSRSRILSEILDIQAKTSLNILATSRIHNEIATLLNSRNTTTLSIVAQNEDMVSMLQSKLRTYDRELFEEGFCDLVVSKIIQVAEGM